jgi:hypothetical protein
MTIERSGPRSAPVHPWSQFTSARLRSTGAGLLSLRAPQHCEYLLPDLQGVGPRYGPARFRAVGSRAGEVRIQRRCVPRRELQAASQRVLIAIIERSEHRRRELVPAAPLPPGAGWTVGSL